MAHPQKARVFMSGRSQAVRIPAEYRFKTDEVFIRRDSQTGDVILSQSPMTWEEVFAVLDAAGFPDDFMSPEDRISNLHKFAKTYDAAVHARHKHSQLRRQGRLAPGPSEACVSHH